MGLIRALLVAVLGITAAFGTASTAAAGGCAGSHATPSQHNAAKVRRATLCLLNSERAKHGLAAMRPNRKLRLAAVRHSLDMVAERYFDHVGPRGDDITLRAKAAHYLRPTASWFLAENIAWGGGALAAPASIVRQWMHSPPHRANILSREVHDAGIGIAVGSPTGGAGATYTLDFGRLS